MFEKLTKEHLTIKPETLREIVYQELTSNDIGEGLTIPVINAITNMLELAKGLNNIVKENGLYVINPKDLTVSYIDNDRGDNDDAIQYVFSNDSYYENSVARFVVEEFGTYTYAEYKEQLAQNLISSLHKRTLDTAIELANNLLDYLKEVERDY